MSEVYLARDQKPARTRKSNPALMTAILCLFLGALQSVKSFAEDTEITPEEVVAKHLKSLGNPEILAAIKTRTVRGTASVEFIQGGFGSLPYGQSLIISERRKLGIIMKFDTYNYPGEYFAFNGHDATVGYLEFTTKSSLGRFLTQYYGLLEEGLMGGAMSVAWPLLDLEERQPKLKYSKRKIEGQQLHELTYDPKSRKGTFQLQIKLFFDFETFRHVMTEYRYSYSYRAMQLLREQFEDFREVDGLTLPHNYTIYYSSETSGRPFPNSDYANPGSAFICRWILKAEQWWHNTQIDPRLFKAESLRVP